MSAVVIRVASGVGCGSGVGCTVGVKVGVAGGVVAGRGVEVGVGCGVGEAGGLGGTVGLAGGEGVSESAVGVGRAPGTHPAMISAAEQTARPGRITFRARLTYPSLRREH